jgi:hypothetical protein
MDVSLTTVFVALLGGAGGAVVATLLEGALREAMT